MAEKKKFNFANAFSDALLSAGEGLTALGGNRVPFYSNYIESRDKRAAIELEAQRYINEQARKSIQDNFNNQVSLAGLAQKDQQMNVAAQGNMLRAGFVPNNQQALLSMDPIARRQALANSPADIMGNRYTMGQGKMSAGRANARDKRTEELINTFSTNAMNREIMGEVKTSLKNLTSGVYGKIGRGFLKQLAPDSPALADYQRVKSFLTDATLGKVKFTKGAVSDAEMQLFKEASGNDELLSSPRVLAVIENAMKAIESEERGLSSSYKKLYGEDPLEWDEIKSLRGSKKSGASKSSFSSLWS